jgi:hypothetical protein
VDANLFASWPVQDDRVFVVAVLAAAVPALSAWTMRENDRLKRLRRSVTCELRRASDFAPEASADVLKTRAL